MPGSRRAKKGQTGKGKNSEAPAGKTWDKKSGPDEHDGRENLQAGSKGKEPRPVPCPYCGREYAGAFTDHVRAKHKDKIPALSRSEETKT